jgi:hypothetical protein
MKAMTEDEIASRDTWTKIMEELQKDHPNGLPLPQSLMPNDMQDIFHCCTVWDPKKRISLWELYEKLYMLLYNKEPSPIIPCIREIVADPCSWDAKERTTAIQMICNGCHSTDTMHGFARAVSFFDRCSGIEAPIGRLACACHILVIMMYGNYVFDDEKLMRNMRKCYGTKDLSDEELQDLVWAIGEELNWDLWEKSADVYLSERNIPDVYSRLLNGLLQVKRPYSMRSLSKGI